MRWRSSYGAKPAADGFVTSRPISAHVRSNAVATASISRRRGDVAIRRLSVLTLTLKPARRNGADRMVGDRGDGADLGVARRRHLEVDLVVEHVAGERPEAQPPSVRTACRGESHAVADALRAVRQRVGDQLEVRRLAGVDGDVEVLRRARTRAPRRGVTAANPSRRRRGRRRRPCARRARIRVDEAGRSPSSAARCASRRRSR